MDGTNNHSERAIGWWIKERYRSMRAYKQEQSALGVNRLIAWAGNHLADGLRLADLMAQAALSFPCLHQFCFFFNPLPILERSPLFFARI